MKGKFNLAAPMIIFACMSFLQVSCNSKIEYTADEKKQSLVCMSQHFNASLSQAEKNQIVSICLAYIKDTHDKKPKGCKPCHR